LPFILSLHDEFTDEAIFHHTIIKKEAKVSIGHSDREMAVVAQMMITEVAGDYSKMVITLTTPVFFEMILWMAILQMNVTMIFTGVDSDDS
jgi:hypothetical protein